MLRAWLLLGAGLASVSLSGCPRSRRPHLAISRDAGPVVVVRKAADRETPSEMGGAPEMAPREWVDEHEPNDARTSAQALESRQGVRGSLAAHGANEPGDADWYRWKVTGSVVQTGDGQAGGGLPAMTGRIELKLRAADGAPPDAGRIGELAVELFNVRGDQGDQDKPLATGAVAGERVVIANVAIAPLQAYWLRVRERQPRKRGAPHPASAALPYQLVVAAEIADPGDEREPDDDAAHATPLMLDSDTRGYFGGLHDEDWLRLPMELSSEEVLRIELTPVPDVAAEVQVRDAAGRVLVQARGGKGGEIRMRNAPAPPGGALVLRTRAGFDVDHPWRMRVVTEPALGGAEREPNDTPAAAQAIDVASDGHGQIAGFLWPGDADLYRLRSSQPSRPLDVELSAPRGVEPHLELLDERGRTQAAGERRGGMVRLHVEVPASGGPLLRVAGRSRDAAFDAPYTLSWGAAEPGQPSGGR